MAAAEDVLQELKEKLEEAGFKTSWDDPFMKWVHPDWYFTPDGQRKKPEERKGNYFFLENLPIPPIVPFDVCAARISLPLESEIGKESLEGFYFTLNIYFCTLLADLLESEQYEERHQQFIRYSVQLHEFLDNIFNQYSFNWDVEFDECFEESASAILSREDLLNLLTDLQYRAATWK